MWRVGPGGNYLKFRIVRLEGRRGVDFYNLDMIISFSSYIRLDWAKE